MAKGKTSRSMSRSLMGDILSYAIKVSQHLIIIYVYKKYNNIYIIIYKIILYVRLMFSVRFILKASCVYLKSEPLLHIALDSWPRAAEALVGAALG